MSLNRRGAGYGRAISDDALTIDSSTAESLPVPASARSCLVTVTGQPARYRFGADPTSSVGHIVADGGNVELFRDDMSSVRFISATGGASTVLFVTFFGD